MKKSIAAALIMSLALMTAGQPGNAADAKKKHLTLAVSIYAGWMPWYFAKEEGVLKKWADKYNLDVDVKYMDYAASLDAFVAGQADACVMTNMEALDMPASAGVDTSAIIMGDYSNGNDAILTRDKLTLPQIKGKKVYLVEKTVSQYLLSRALEKEKMKESEVKIVNVSDSDIAPSFMASKDQEVVVTWNPMVMEIEKNRGITKVFDSSAIPGEIQDLCVVNTKVLNANPDFARALVGTWYDVLGVINQQGAKSEAAIKKMADLSKASPAEFKSQLRTTALYNTADAAVKYTKSDELKQKQDQVRNFCFTHNLLGEHAKSVDVVGIEYPDGTIQGDKNKVKMRYVSKYMEEAAAGKISLK